MVDDGADRPLGSLRQAWDALGPGLTMLEPLHLPPEHWSVLERMHVRFNDRDAHTRLPIPIARFRAAASNAIHGLAKRFDEVETVSVEAGRVPRRSGDGPTGAMADYARLYNDEVDRLIGVLFPSARYRKGHYAYGRFTVPAPHGLHTDHSAEDPGQSGEPICIARIETLGTHYVTGDYRHHDAETRSMLDSLKYWMAVPEGEPEEVLARLLQRQTLKTIPVNHVVLMVAGNGAEDAQVTQHLAARPPEGGLHSAFFQRQYRLA